MLHRTATDFAAHYFTRFSRCWRFNLQPTWRRIRTAIHYRSLEINKISALKTSGNNTMLLWSSAPEALMI